ncbi:MAG: sugar kinase [Candidatus Bathyarchaeia archaeon]
MLDIATMGEVMVQFNAVSNGPLRHVIYFEKHAAGAEANFAIGMTRLGFKAGIITKVRDDEFGRYIINVLRSEGIDVSQIKFEPEAPNGVYFIQRNYPVPGKSSVIYYRKGSAASKLSIDDLDPEYVRDAKLFHLTGITPALSQTCKEASFEALRIASESGLTVSFDTNIRLSLWSKDDARSTLLSMLKKANIVFTEPQDGEILFGTKNPREIADKILQLGSEMVVVKLGEDGAAAYTKETSVMKPAFKVPIVDVIGAGDAFAAGFISSILRGLSLEEALEIGNATGALVVTVRGDFENSPTLDDVKKFLAANRKEIGDLR